MKNERDVRVSSLLSKCRRNGEKTSLCSKSSHPNESFPHFSRTLPSTIIIFLSFFFFCFRRRENINEKAIGIISIKRSPGAHILTDIDICCGVRTNRDKGSNIIASRLGLRYSCWCACVARDKLCCKTKLLYFVVFAAFNVVALSFSSAEWFLSCFKNIFPLI